MKRLSVISIIILLFAGVLFAQDPGVQDSIIVGSVAHVDSSGEYQFIELPVYAVTDDSVAFYNLPLSWRAPSGGVSIEQGTQYFPPISQWAERFDSVITNGSFVRQFGWVDLDSLDRPLLMTDSSRVNVWTIRIVVAPNAPSQIVEIDTCYDAINGPILFGLWRGVTEFAPAFVKGAIAIEPVGIDEPSLPIEYSLSQNYPNPFNPTTAIDFSIAARGQVALEIFNLLGQRVSVLANGIYEAGVYSVAWNGADENGIPVSSGAYFYRLTANGYSSMKRMLLLK